MPIHINLKYESRDGTSIQTPDGYPDGINIDLNSKDQVTDEIVLMIVCADLQLHNTPMQDIIISWSAFDPVSTN